MKPRDVIEVSQVEDFETRLRATARQGFAVDHQFLGESRKLVRTLVERTWSLFDAGDALVPKLDPASRPIVWLLGAGGRTVLRRIEQWNYETILHRPVLGRLAKLGLIARASVRFRGKSPRKGTR